MSAANPTDNEKAIGGLVIALWALIFAFVIRPYCFCLVIGHVLGGIHVSYWDGLLLAILVGGPVSVSNKK
jgi:hypothetical protein